APAAGARGGGHPPQPQVQQGERRCGEEEDLQHRVLGGRGRPPGPAPRPLRRQRRPEPERRRPPLQARRHLRDQRLEQGSRAGVRLHQHQELEGRVLHHPRGLVSGPGHLADQARAWLDRRGWAWEEEADGDGLVLAVGDRPSGERWRWYLQVREPQHQVALFAILDDDVPPERRSPMAELVLRASFGLTVGGFELDLDDGQLRYRTGVGLGPVAAGGLDLGALLDEMAGVNQAMTGVYGPAITAVLAGEEPAAAVQAVEG
ncbi:hypothetical protein GHK86_19570, partial [Acidimicrobiaceae bacterium USS-CC1]|nr:hypothetical protein [Acidiferrimicrobium australe]